MKIRKLKSADYLLIASNLIPVYGVWFLGWDTLEAFIAYTLETLVIGAVTILKLLVATFYKKHDTWYAGEHVQEVSGFLFVFFFAAHFGIFVAVQMSIFSNVAGLVPDGKGLLYFVTHFWYFINKEVAMMLGAFVIGYLAQSFVPFMVNGEYKTTPMIKLMFQPYGRIFVQQLTVIAGSMFLVFGWGAAFVFIFALVKILFEIMVDYNKLLDKAMVDMKSQGTTRID